MATKAPKSKATNPKSGANATPEKDKKSAAKTATMERYISEIDRFAEMLSDQQRNIRELEEELAIARTKYDEAKQAVKEQKDVEHATVSLLLKFIRPGSIEILPLFDTMEPADEEIHGVNASEWRNESIARLGLSAAALRALIDAEIVLVGQLQDRIVARPSTWMVEIEGLNDGMAQAIEAKLDQFVEAQR